MELGGRALVLPHGRLHEGDLAGCINPPIQTNKKKKKMKEGRKEMRKGTRNNITQGTEPDGKGPGTTL